MEDVEGQTFAQLQQNLHLIEGVKKDYERLDNKFSHANTMISQLSPFESQLLEIQLAALKLKDSSLTREFSHKSSENDELSQELLKSNYSLEVLLNVFKTKEQELLALEKIEQDNSRTRSIYFRELLDLKEKIKFKANSIELLEKDNDASIENISEKKELLIRNLEELRILENRILQAKGLIERRREELSKQDAEIQVLRNDIRARDTSPVSPLGSRKIRASPEREKEPIGLHSIRKPLFVESPEKAKEQDTTFRQEAIENEEAAPSVRYGTRASTVEKPYKRIGVYEAAILLLVSLLCFLIFTKVANNEAPLR